MHSGLQTTLQPSLRLILDLLYDVASYLDISDLKRFSVVCKLLYTPALRQLLSRVILQRPDQLVGFCASVLVDVTQRAAWIRDLTVNSHIFEWEGEFPDARIVDISNISALTTIIGECRGLNTLSVDSLDLVADSYPRISSAIASLPHLKVLSIHLSYDDAAAFDILAKLRCKLHSLSITFQDDFPGPEQLFRPGPSAPPPSTASIEKLTLWGGVEPGPWEIMRHFQWQSVRTLSMYESFVDLKTLATALPNLQILDLYDCYTTFDNSAICETLVLWPALDTLIQGTYPSWPIFSVQCPIRCIEFYCGRSYFSASDSEIEIVFNLLQAAQPLVLFLGSLDSQLDQDFWRRFGSISSNLCCLEFDIAAKYDQDRVELVVRLSVRITITR